jgi:CO dehydrogenase nickel-insertion accessory protein CooC1
MAKIHMVLQGKCGVGKSFIAALIILRNPPDLPG